MKKKIPSYYNKKLPLFLLIATLFIGICYAALNATPLEISGTITMQEKEGLFISDIEFSESLNNNTEKMDTISTFNTTINSKVTLSNNDNESYTTYIITIYNNSSNNYYYTGTTYDEEFYDNQDIVYTVNNSGNNIIKSHSISIFYITFNYKNSILSSNNILYSYIKFNFDKIHLVTYENISKENLPEYVRDNETLNITFEEEISPSFKVYTNNNLTTNYTFSNNSLTIPYVNVTGNIKIVGYIPVVNLSNSLIPVTYNGTSWVVTSNNSTWYDYDSQNWANAVILKNNVTKNTGDIVDIEQDIMGIFVWIPRYEYKITNNIISVNFISTDTTTATTDYIIPDAFTFDNTEIAGIWFGKFETSMNDTTQKLYVIPNAKAALNLSVSTQYNLSLNFASDLTNIDSHMTKNSEWGVAAYLSKSKYGKFGNNNYTSSNKEVYVNNSISLYTGRSGGSTSPEATSEGTYYYDDGFVPGTEISGIGASTTGNITGIYDMSGGAYEYVMGYLTSNTYDDSGFSSLPDSKYLDSYTNSTSSYYPYYSHALYETSGWYNDNSIDVDSAAPWYLRGDVADTKELAGIFAYKGATGGAGSYATFRLSLVVN